MLHFAKIIVTNIIIGLDTTVVPCFDPCLHSVMSYVLQKVTCQWNRSAFVSRSVSKKTKKRFCQRCMNRTSISIKQTNKQTTLPLTTTIKANTSQKKKKKIIHLILTMAYCHRKNSEVFFTGMSFKRMPLDVLSTGG